MLKSFRNAFISGLLLLAPLGVTLFVIQFLIERIGAPTSAFFFPFVPEDLRDQRWLALILNLLATVYVVILITMLGYFSRLFIGRIVVQQAERIFNSIPFANTIYSTVKQIIDTFAQQKQAVFQKVVLVQWPQEGNFVIGFLTSEGKGEVQARTEGHICNLFIPTTPNPTSGYLVMVPRDRFVDLDMTVSDGMKLIISGGAVVPPYAPTAAPVQIRNPEQLQETRGAPAPTT
jgi:uncharacterized membrane protein